MKSALCDQTEFRRACSVFGTGVTVVTARHGSQDHAMTANAFMSISLDPPIVAISVADRARMCPILQKAGKFAISILPEGTQNVALHFAGKRDPYLSKPFSEKDDMPVIRQASAWFTAEVCDVVHVGDHHVFFGRVNQVSTNAEASPMIYCKGQFGEFAQAARTGV